MRPPDAPPPRQATGAGQQITGQVDRHQRTCPVRQPHAIMGRHAWAACAVRSMDRGRCPRCCWCADVCDCPESAWQVAS
jgi:hypothetical protein